MKRATLIIFLLLLSLSLCAVTFSSRIESTDGDLRFASGFFPVSGKLAYDMNLPDYFDEVNTALTLNFNTGLKHRLLIQNPDTGVHLDTLSSTGYETDEARFYQVQFIYFTLDLKFGLFNVDYLSSPILTLYTAIEANYENAYERIGWLNGDGEESTFTYIEDGLRKERYTNYSGVREFKSDSSILYRRLSHIGGNIGIKYDYTETTRMTKDGLWADLFLHVMPSWTPLHDKNGSSYIRLTSNAGVAVTLLDISQFSLATSSDVLKMFTLVLESEFDMRYVYGKYVPQYALERDSWGYHNPNTSFLFGNKTSLTFRGPQILEDVYPTIKLLSDISLSTGSVVNGFGSMTKFSGSISLKGEINLFDTLILYGEAGYVYSSILKNDCGFKYSFGVRIAVYE